MPIIAANLCPQPARHLQSRRGAPPPSLSGPTKLTWQYRPDLDTFAWQPCDSALNRSPPTRDLVNSPAQRRSGGGCRKRTDAMYHPKATAKFNVGPHLLRVGPLLAPYVTAGLYSSGSHASQLTRAIKRGDAQRLLTVTIYIVTEMLSHKAAAPACYTFLFRNREVTSLQALPAPMLLARL